MKDVKVVNLTPHTVRVVVEEQEIEFPASGSIARITSESVVIGDVNGIPVTETVWGEVINLPEPQENTIYICSMPVVEQVKSFRQDVMRPDTGPTCIRKDGQIWAVKGFAR
jgi:hypothetical protein